MVNPKDNIWPDRLRIRDTQLRDDIGGAGMRIYTTAGQGYEKRDYIRGDLYETLLTDVKNLRTVIGIAIKDEGIHSQDGKDLQQFLKVEIDVMDSALTGQSDG